MLDSAAPDPALLDERTLPDFRTVYGRLFRRSDRVDVAIRKIRLAGVSLGERELGGPDDIRVLLAEINALTLAAEAEAMAVTTAGRRRVGLLLELLEGDALRIRSAPLGGWAPDFSLFHQHGADTVLLTGLHWFERPYPHRGPALASLHRGLDAVRIAGRFENIWGAGHDVAPAIRRILEAALTRVPAPAPGAAHEG